MSRCPLDNVIDDEAPDDCSDDKLEHATEIDLKGHFDELQAKFEEKHGNERKSC